MEEKKAHPLECYYLWGNRHIYQVYYKVRITGRKNRRGCVGFKPLKQVYPTSLFPPVTLAGFASLKKVKEDMRSAQLRIRAALLGLPKGRKERVIRVLLGFLRRAKQIGILNVDVTMLYRMVHSVLYNGYVLNGLDFNSPWGDRTTFEVDSNVALFKKDIDNAIRSL
jgi:hypothetical protein